MSNKRNPALAKQRKKRIFHKKVMRYNSLPRFRVTTICNGTTTVAVMPYREIVGYLAELA
jgi:hypothetical protein